MRTSITIPFRANFAFKKECLRIERVELADEPPAARRV